MIVRPDNIDRPFLGELGTIKAAYATINKQNK